MRTPRDPIYFKLIPHTPYHGTSRRNRCVEFAPDSLLEGAGFETLGPPPPGARRQIPGLQAKTPFAASLRAAGEEREWVSGPDCGPVGNCKSKRPAQGLVNH